MAQLIVSDLADDVRDKLRELARDRGQSLEEMIREILQNIATGQSQPQFGLGTQFAQQFSSTGLEEGEEIPELRGNFIEPLIDLAGCLNDGQPAGTPQEEREAAQQHVVERYLEQNE